VTDCLTKALSSLDLARLYDKMSLLNMYLLSKYILRMLNIYWRYQILVRDSIEYQLEIFNYIFSIVLCCLPI
jgi:hypothetical protein